MLLRCGGALLRRQLEAYLHCLPSKLLHVVVMSQTPHEGSQYGSTGSLDEPESPYHLQENQEDALPNDVDAESSLDEEYEMSLTELLYSSSSYHAIVKPGLFLCSGILLLFRALLSTLTHTSSRIISNLDHDDGGLVRYFCQ